MIYLYQFILYFGFEMDYMYVCINQVSWLKNWYAIINILFIYKNIFSILTSETHVKWCKFNQIVLIELSARSFVQTSVKGLVPYFMYAITY